MKTLAILATYNEAENIENLAEEILQKSPDIEMLIIDDNSPDGTGKIADALHEKEKRINIIHRPAKLGLASATIEGFEFAMKNRYDFALVMDADFSHHPKYIPAILKEAAESSADIVIGSRYVPGGGTANWGFLRRLSSCTVNLFSRCILGIKAADCSGAFRLYRISQLRQMDFKEIISTGYSFQEEILLRCQRKGLSIREVPIIFSDRERGASKLTAPEIVRSAFALFKLACLALLGKV